MRVMALDYGDARTGVAISDERGVLCGETLVINEWDAQALAQRVAKLAQERGAGLILLGLPLNMDGSEGPRAANSPRCCPVRARRKCSCATRGAPAWRPTPYFAPTANAKKSTAGAWTPWRRS